MAKKNLSMVYSEDFITRVTKAYPKFPHVADQMKNGACEVIYNFLRSWTRNPDWKIILNASSLEEIQEIARLEQERHDIYSTWIGLFMSQHPEAVDFLSKV